MAHPPEVTEQPEEQRDSRPPAAPVMMTRLTVWRVMVFTAAVLFVVFVANILLRVTDVLILGFVGILLATAINPFARRLQLTGLSRTASILVVYLLAVIVFGALIAFVIPPIITQGTDFINRIPDYTQQFQNRFKSSNQAWLQEIIAQVSLTLNRLYEQPPDVLKLAQGYAGNVVARVFNSLVSIVTVILISFYWLSERILIRRSLLSFVATENRERVGKVWDHIEEKLGAWFRAQLVLCAIIGVASAIFYGILDLKYWPFVAFVAGVAEIIPILGPWIGGIPAVFIALLNSPVQAIIVLVFIVVLQQIEGNVLVPRIQGDAIGLSPLYVILAILAGAALAGPLGGLLAVPISAIIQVLVQDLVISRFTPDPQELQPALDAAARRTVRGEPPLPDTSLPTKPSGSGSRVIGYMRNLPRSRAMAKPRPHREGANELRDGD